jgi:hypothetical protein
MVNVQKHNICTVFKTSLPLIILLYNIDIREHYEITISLNES